jgi:hypothetical protein
MKAGDADDPGSGAPDPGCCVRAETKVGDGGGVAERQKGRGDVLESERFYPKKGSETELLVTRVGAKEENIHY